MSYKEIEKLSDIEFHYTPLQTIDNCASEITRLKRKINEIIEALNAEKALEKKCIHPKDFDIWDGQYQKCSTCGAINLCINCKKNCKDQTGMDKCIVYEPIQDAEKANDPQELCGHILQHTIAGEIKCAEKRPCKFHDVPEKGKPTLKSDEQIQMDYYDLLNREEKAERCPEYCIGHPEKTGIWVTNGICNDCGLPIKRVIKTWVEDYKPKCVLCNGLGRIKDGMSQTSDCYRTCPQCLGKLSTSGIGKTGAEKAERCPDHISQTEKMVCPACKGTGGWMFDGLWHKCTAVGCKGKLSTSGEDKLEKIIAENMPIEFIQVIEPFKRAEVYKKLAHAIMEQIK